jgi:hypothetical protein
MSAPKTRIGLTLVEHASGCLVTKVSDSAGGTRPQHAHLSFADCKMLVFDPFLQFSSAFP